MLTLSFPPFLFFTVHPCEKRKKAFFLLFCFFFGTALPTTILYTLFCSRKSHFCFILVIFVYFFPCFFLLRDMRASMKFSYPSLLFFWSSLYIKFKGRVSRVGIVHVLFCALGMECSVKIYVLFCLCVCCVPCASLFRLFSKLYKGDFFFCGESPGN